MINEELLGITRVQETHSETEANDLLSKGWKLLNIYTGSFSVEFTDQINIYVLGRTGEPRNI